MRVFEKRVLRRILGLGIMKKQGSKKKKKLNEA